ncbi:MAG: HAD hydrolase-like protein [Oscillospiraceae bacterium]
MAVNAGAQSVLVMSGETDEAILKASDVQPKYVLHDVAELAQILRGGATA